MIYFFSALDYPHKYGPQGGCADHSVFERMRKYQMTGVEEGTQVRISAFVKLKTWKCTWASVSSFHIYVLGVIKHLYHCGEIFILI